MHTPYGIHLGWNIGPPKDPKIHYTRLRTKIMENEERAHLEAHYQRELENMKDDIARLTSLLEQALVFKSREGTST